MHRPASVDFLKQQTDSQLDVTMQQNCRLTPTGVKSIRSTKTENESKDHT